MRSSSPSSARHRPGRNAIVAAVSTSPLPSALATATLPARTACMRPGVPSADSPSSSSGSQKPSSWRRRITCTGEQARERLQIDAVVAHGEVVALDERDAEVAREIGVLEVGLVVRPGREQHDARPAGRRRELDQRVAERLEEAGEPLDVEVAERLGQDARHHDPVLERIARARRRLRAVADHPPLPVRRAREVGGEGVQIAVARHAHAVTRPQEVRIAVHELGRQQRLAQQAPLRRRGRRGSGRAAARAARRPPRGPPIPPTRRAAGSDRAATGGRRRAGRRRRCR